MAGIPDPHARGYQLESVAIEQITSLDTPNRTAKLPKLT